MLRPVVVVLVIVSFVFSVAEGHSKSINNRDISSESPQAVLDVTTEKNSGKNVEYEDDDVDDEEDEEEEKEDEYEVELHQVAESHEAMSRDDRRNSSIEINHSDTTVVMNGNRGAGNFDSHEKSVEEHSDESITSNEAISKEKDDEQDVEVQELLKYKNPSEIKIKRVPTVKKELRTQKEIQGNTTKIAVPTEIISQLDDRQIGYSPVRTREMTTNELVDQDGIQRSYHEKSFLQGEIIPGDEYMDLDASIQILKNLDKRRGSDLDSSEAYPPSPHIPEFEKQTEIQEVAEEVETVLAEELMDRILTKLASRPSQWDYASRLLKNLLEHLEASRSTAKRNSPSLNSAISNPSAKPPIDPKPTQKKAKKKKKKKKKPRRFGPIETSTSTTTTSTQSPETTTKSRWRLVAEKLFGPVWNSNNEKNDKTEKNIEKLHYALKNDKIKSDLPEYFNDQPSMILETTRDYLPQTRKFHFGKVNTHEKGSPLNHNDDESSSFVLDTSDGPSTSRLLDYDLSERNYHQQHKQQQQQKQKQLNSRVTNDRYNQYPYQQHTYSNLPSRQRDFDTDPIIDYDDTYTDVDYSRLRSGFRSKPRKYHRFDMSRTRDMFYNDDDNGELKNNDRKVDRQFNNNHKNWPGRYRTWKSYWRPIIEVDEEINEEENNGRIYEKLDNTWPIEMDIDKNKVSPWTIIDTTRSKIQDKINQQREVNDTVKHDNKDDKLPKITMTTWNSLTSDPATWPFKLSGAKPWPKDKNGKSYNPNAELVHKLGLDKQNRLLDTKNDNDDENNDGKERIVDNKNTGMKETFKNIPQNDESRNWNNNDNDKIWSTKTDSKINWKSQDRWEDNDDRWPGKLTNWNVDYTKQSSQPVTWSPKWKQFSYHKVNNLPKSDGTIDSSTKPRNSFIAVSAVSPSGDWRKNDIEEIAVDQQNINDNNQRNIDHDDPTRQMLFQTPWKKNNIDTRGNKLIKTDLLENQLEDLRQNNFNKRFSSTQSPYLQSTTVAPMTTMKNTEKK